MTHADAPAEFIWAVPAYLSYLQPPLTPEVVAAAETTLGVRLPAAYLSLLQDRNGGYVRRVCPDSPHQMIWGVGPHFPTITDQSWRAVDDADADGIWLPTKPALLVAFDGDGHWCLCLDYRDDAASRDPCVSLIDLEAAEDRRVVDSFAGFLSTLVPKTDHVTFGIVGHLPMPDVVAALDAAFGVGVDQLDTESYGYAVHRWPLVGAETRAWAWLSANRVPHGFVRPSDPRYAELAGLLPGTALRWPADPDVGYLLECTDGVVHRVGDACVRAGLRVRRLG